MRSGELVADRFEVAEQVGRGSMGAVFRAHDRATRLPVALKVLHADLEAATLERFQREAKILSELEHPAIVKYVAEGKTPAGEPFLALEWLEGETLSARLKRGPLSLREAVPLGVRVLGALFEAHERGVLHRDVKPSNLVLVGGEARGVRLLDFGIALLQQGAHLTETGATLGTPGYMAPEQARGERDLDARVDLYSVGCVLFHALAGRPPIVAERPLAVLLKVVLEDAPRLRELRSDTPDTLDDLVASLLARARDERPETAAIAARSLRTSLDEMTPSRRRPGPEVLGATEWRATCLLLVRGLDAHLRGPALATLAAKFGAELDRLADGTALLAFGGDEVGASDAARRAARAALSITDALAGTHAVLAAARTQSEGVTTRAAGLGVAIEGVAGLFVDGAPTSGIRVDEVTRDLLAPWFTIDARDGALFLATERDVEDAARPLLGRPTPCVGRDVELATLEALVAQGIEDSAARSALVIAPAGAGKSRLRHELLRRIEAHGGARVWIARGDPMTSDVAFSLLGPMLRRAAGARDADPTANRQAALSTFVEGLVAPDLHARVTTFVAEIAGAPFASASSAELAAARRDPQLMGDQARRAWLDLLAAHCARAPLVLVLEDLHWSDASSVKLVLAALRELRNAPLLVLALARPELESAFPDLDASWSLELRLPDLPRGASERLARSLLGPSASAARVAAIVERSAGNAFYLEELIRRSMSSSAGDGPASLPASIVAMAESRLEDVDPSARRALRAASVFGLRFLRSGLAQLLGVTEDSADLARWLDDLVQHELCIALRRADPTSDLELSFRHALVREAAYATLAPDDRALGHRLAGRFLERRTDADAAVVAEHFDRGGDSARAVGWRCRAAEQALESNDLDAALRHVERGLASGAAGAELGRLRVSEAEARNWRGEYAAERDRALEALTLVAPGSMPWCRAARSVARASGALADVPRLEAIADALVPFAVGSPIPTHVAVATLTAAARLFFAGKYDRARALIALFEREGALPEDDASSRASLHVARGISAAFAGDYGEQRAEYLRAIGYAALVGDHRITAAARVNMSHATALLGMYAEAEATLRDALPDAERLGMKRMSMAVKNNLAEALEGQGRLDEARAMAIVAVQEAALQGDVRMTGGSRIHLARALFRAGRLDDAEQVARLAATELVSSRPLACYALGVLSRVLLALGRQREALEESTSAMKLMAEQRDIEEGEATVRLAHVEALLAGGRVDDAARSARVARERLLERASRIRDLEMRRSFLQNVRDNAATFALRVDA